MLQTNQYDDVFIVSVHASPGRNDSSNQDKCFFSYGDHWHFSSAKNCPARGLKC